MFIFVRQLLLVKPKISNLANLVKGR